MKKYILKFGLIIAAFAALLIACEQELFEGDGSNEISLSVGEARDWFENNQPEFLVLKSADTEKNKKVIKPKWDGAFSSQNEKVEVVETHIVSSGGFGLATPDAYEAWIETNHYGYTSSLTRLVVLKYKKTGEMVSFLMTIVGDKEYLEKKEFKMWTNTYLTKDKDFNGFVLFHSLDGAYVNGWRFENGKSVAKVTQLEYDPLPVILKSATCYVIVIYETTYKYVDWYVNGEFDHTQYVGSTSTVLSQYEVCQDEGGGGGDGYEPPDDNSYDPNLPCLGDPIRNPSINPTPLGQKGGLYGCIRTGGSNCSSGIYNRFHNGVDISAPGGTDIYTMYEGTVLGNYYEEDGFGNYTVVRSQIDGKTVDIYYAHLNYATLEPGSYVPYGTVVGIAGSTGNAIGTEPHVHIKIKENGATVDPLPYFATGFDENDGSLTSVCN